MKLEKKNNSFIENLPRRSFLRYSALAVAALMVGKALDSVLGVFSSKKTGLNSFEPGEPEEKVKTFDNFAIKETRGKLVFSDKAGREIFIIEK